MKGKRTGRPKEPRLPNHLGSLLQIFLKKELKNRGLPAKVFHEEISKRLRNGFNVFNQPSTVKRDLRGICTGRTPFREEYRECIQAILCASLPNPIIDYLKNPAAGLGALERGGVPSKLNTKEYFDLFFDYLESNDHLKKVCVFARWTNLEARRILLKFGPENLFLRFQDVAKRGLIDVEYVFFLLSPASLDLPDVVEILEQYSRFASEIRLHYLSETGLPLQDTDKTISIWEGYHTVFTHDWDYQGNIHNLREWQSADDQNELLQTYERIKSSSMGFFRRGDM